MIAFMSFKSDLKKLGLADKESSVYLAALGLGPSTVQVIARKAKVARATTYLVLESLMKLGLITRFEEGSKTFFVAETPNQLGRLLDRRQQIINEERDELAELMPKLMAFMKSVDNNALVRYYQGIDGIKGIRAEMMMSSEPGDLWRQIAPVDYMQAMFGDEDFTFARQRKAKRIKSRAIIATKSPDLKGELARTAEKKWAERKFVDPRVLTSSTGASFYKDRIVITTYEGEGSGAIIESRSVATMMAELFDMAWSALP